MCNRITIAIGFLRRARFIFNLAALKTATQAAAMDLGEFYTSEKISESYRFFLNCYGSWRQGKEYTEKSMKKFRKIYNRFTISQIEKIKTAYISSQVISNRLQDAVKKKTKIR